MSREVLIRFGTRNLDKAAAAAKAIQKNVREALKQVKDVKRRKEMMRIAREEQREDRRILKEQRERARANQRAGKLAERSRRQVVGGAGPKFGDPDESIIAFLEGRGGARAVDMVARSLSALPIVGSVLGTIWEEVLRKEFLAAMQALERERLQPLLVRLERIEANDIRRRLREDAPFREMLARQEMDRSINRGGVWTRGSRLRDL